MSNIAEGFGRYAFEDKRRFFDIALGPCKEVQSQLSVALDQGYLTEDEFGEAYSQAETVARLITGSLARLERQIVNRRPNHGRVRTVRKQPTRTVIDSSLGSSHEPLNWLLFLTRRTVAPPNRRTLESAYAHPN
jgi:hypothetical protein